jgi:cell division septation protein DedD
VPTRLFLLSVCLAGCARSGRDIAVAADSANRAATRAVPAVAFRVPVSGGSLAVYQLPTLQATPWGAGSRLVGARSAVGVDIIGRRLLFRDAEGQVASFDLVALRQRTIAPRHALATLAADGAVLAVDPSGGITESQPWGTRQWSGSLGRGVREVFAAPGSRLIAIRRGHDDDTLQIAERETGIARTQSVPSAVDRAPSRDGDAVALATDSGIIVFEDRDMDHPWFVHVSGKPRAVAFSPSGHRLYVALSEKSELAVIDRFMHRERAAISLPGPAIRLRTDPWGRVLLARGEADGDTWVVSIPANIVVGSITSGWASDLPTVSENGVILAREGSAVVARDLHTLDSLGAVASGARDLWFAGRWVPSSETAAIRADFRPSSPPVTESPTQRAEAPSPAPAEGAPVRAPAVSAAPRTTAAAPRANTVAPNPAAPFAAAPAPAPAYYVQLIATRSEDAARSLAAQLTEHRTIVFPPRPGTGDDNWRVMAGPFRTRDAADSAGRDIGRSYWIVDKSRDREEVRP